MSLRECKETFNQGVKSKAGYHPPLVIIHLTWVVLKDECEEDDQIRRRIRDEITEFVDSIPPKLTSPRQKQQTQAAMRA